MWRMRLILSSLVYHWRSSVAVGAGVAAGTAVLTGALVVGDSMRASLRRLTLERLGRIDEVLVRDHFFRARLADELAAQPDFHVHFAETLPAILLRVGLENADGSARASGVQLLGCEDRFWQLGHGGPDSPLADRQIVLNQPLATQLRAKVNDRVTVWLPRGTMVPADTPLGQRRDTLEAEVLSVGAILPAEGLGRFSLAANQQAPRNAYVSLKWLQRRLKREQQANAIFVAGPSADRNVPEESSEALQRMLKPTLADFGIQLKQTTRGYFSVTTDRMILDPAAERQILRSLDGMEVRPALTYLANKIVCEAGIARRHQAAAVRDAKPRPENRAAKKQLEKPWVAYATVTAVDFSDKRPLGPLLDTEGRPIGPLKEDEIVLNSWAAAQLNAQPGDEIQLSWFEPETLEGQVRERTGRLRLRAVAAMTEAADDPALTPEVSGLTDKESVNDWDPPFPFHPEWLRLPEDDDYWQKHRATPKGFISWHAGRMWHSRFGRATSLLIRPDSRVSPEELHRRISLDPRELGFVFQPVKRQGLAAAQGTTPFSVLFLLFSFFLIAAAVMLVVLLFRLGVDGRAEQLGILLAMGFRRRTIIGLLAAEGFLVAAAGSLAGMLLGIGYAAVMIFGLRTWWQAAVGTQLLSLHVKCTSLAMGCASGIVLAILTISWAVRRAGRVPARQLLSGSTGAEEPVPLARHRRRLGLLLGWLALAAALGVSLVATAFGEEARAGAFFAAGSLVLTGCLSLIGSALRSGRTGAAVSSCGAGLPRMALRNAARNPGRSILTIGLIAAACFLIVAVSGFRLDPAAQSRNRASGTGGFALVAETDQPVYQDLNSPQGQAELGFSPADCQRLRAARIFALRVRPGDDASCLNLYRPRQPRILGLPEAFLQRGGFQFAACRRGGQEAQLNPWQLLRQDLGVDGDGAPRVPVILDDATAKYSLHLWAGIGQTLDIDDGRGRTIRLEVVGLLRNSIFQGDLLVSEAALLRHMPAISGYRAFLIDCEPEQTEAVQSALERTLGTYGFAAQAAERRLAAFMAVQNTYLSTFQSLGGLGLLLGTFGLAAVQLRNVLERRRELALLQAVGFRRRSLAWLTLLESAFLLIIGLCCGVVAALVALLPHLAAHAASIPWLGLTGTLAAVVGAGLGVGLVAVRAVLAAPLLSALRGE